MRTAREGRATTVGPVAVAILGLVAIAIGAAVKTGFIQVRRGGPSADSSGVVVRTGAGDVDMPVPRAGGSALVASAVSPAPPTPKELASDTLISAAARNDTNAVRPTPNELAELASQLIVPVAGVQPSDLLDTFDEPRAGHRHNALDIPAPRGTPVLSATAGSVLKLFTSKDGGLMVYASDPSDRFVLMYA